MAVRPVQPALIEGYPDRPVGRIPPSVMGGTNSDLIAAIAPLYLTGSVMDITYGRGGWWRRFTPDPFICHDLYTLDGVDFRALPEADRSVDAVCFDPPYTISGGESSAALAGGPFQTAYGIGQSRIAASEFEVTIRSGLAEAIRVSRRWVLIKCMEFAQGGSSLHDIPFLATAWAAELGAVKHDLIVHHTGSGPGGHNIFDTKRARRHHSYLIVLAAP